jgi:predicted MPP superfamily phosphohydrolase
MWAAQTGNAEESNAYRRSAFNEYGDNIYPRPASEGEIDFSSVRMNHISDEAAERINALNDYLTKRGATLLVAGYPIAECDTTPSREEYSAFGRELQEKLDCAVISDYNDYRMDTSYFYDSYLHMTDEGVTLRTNLFINDLHRYLLTSTQ